ncbi:MAG: long-chain acyl-CoA synthetase [Planctomycetota bacterium]|jgi:long-chain acyl-CoA synthetase
MDTRPWHQHYSPGVPTEIDLEEVPLSRYLERTAARVPGRVAVSFKNCTLTYAALKSVAERLATAMQGMGIGPGKSVAIQLPNIPQTVIATQAALMTGARVVMTNPLYTEREIEHQWNDAEVDLAITADFIWVARVRAMRERLPAKNYIIATIPEYLKFPLNLLAPLKLKKATPPLFAKFKEEAGVFRFKKLVHSTVANLKPVDVSMDDIALLQYTGGTTGVSKGAMLTHRNIAANVHQIHAWFSGMQYGEEVLLTALPIFHVFGLTVCTTFGIWFGAELALVANPRDFKSVVDTVVKRGVTLFPAVPAMFNALNNYPGIENIDVSSIKACFSGSAPITPEILERFEKLTKSRILEGFGMSESSPVTHVNPIRGLRKIGTVGIPVSSTDARIVDADDSTKVLATGEEGELVIRGPQVMPGYWKREGETAKTIIDGWLHTGDLASMDADGFFKIVGRKKDMINCNGMKVYPDEVDAVLMAHPKILEATTIGIPHPERIETVKSFIVLLPGESLTAEEIEAYTRENLASYKIPREIEFIDELPKSTVLKVLRRELRDRELAKRS